MKAIFGQSMLAAETDFILKVSVESVYNQIDNRQEAYPWHFTSGWVFLISVKMVEHIVGVDARQLLGNVVTVRYRRANSMETVLTKQCTWQAGQIRFEVPSVQDDLWLDSIVGSDGVTRFVNAGLPS